MHFSKSQKTMQAELWMIYVKKLEDAMSIAWTKRWLLNLSGSSFQKDMSKIRKEP